MNIISTKKDCKGLEPILNNFKTREMPHIIKIENTLYEVFKIILNINPLTLDGKMETKLLEKTIVEWSWTKGDFSKNIIYNHLMTGVNGKIIFKSEKRKFIFDGDIYVSLYEYNLSNFIFAQF